VAHAKLNDISVIATQTSEGGGKQSWIAYPPLRFALGLAAMTVLFDAILCSHRLV